jgi:hypothetical protein
VRIFLYGIGDGCLDIGASHVSEQSVPMIEAENVSDLLVCAHEHALPIAGNAG